MFGFTKRVHGSTVLTRRGITSFGCIDAETVARVAIAADISNSGYTGFPHALRLATRLTPNHPTWCGGATYTLTKEGKS